jgi:parallel beta-helix repeat protein
VGPSGNYKTIQAAVNAASAGNTIVVSNGTYKENVHVGKSLTIKAAGGTTPVVDGSGKDSCFFVNSKNVRIEGFTLQNSGASDCGIYMAASNAILANNTINGCGWGIYLSSAGGSCTLRGNTVTGSTTVGIGLYGSKNNVITGSTTSGNKIGLLINSASSGNVIYLNDFKDTPSVAGTNKFNSTAMQIYTYKGKQYKSYIGNYWAGYKGTDANGDGLGDTTYTSGTLKDTCPLVDLHSKYVIVG